MDTTARLDLSVWRNDDVYEFPLQVRGVDLTGTPMVMQVRSEPDTPGAPFIDLATVTNGNAQGIRLAGVTLDGAVSVSDVRIRINKSTLQSLPYVGEVGDASPFAYAFLIAGTTRLVGQLIVLAHAYGSDAAPSGRPDGYGSPNAYGPATGATLTISATGGATLIIGGADLIEGLIDKARDAADAALASATAATEAAANITASAENIPKQIDDTSGSVVVELDSAGRVIRRITDIGHEHLADMPHGLSVQEAIRSPRGRGFLPAAFKPLGPSVPAAARYVTAGMPRDMRPNPATKDLAAYTFRWPPDPAGISQVRRVVGTLGTQTWSVQATYLDPAKTKDIERNHQIRDISPMRDRLTGDYWIAINSISYGQNAWVGSGFTLAKATNDNGQRIITQAYVELPIPTLQVWSPEWFVDPDNGEIYIIISANKKPQDFTGSEVQDSRWGYHLMRCVDLATAQFDYLGELTGSAFPKATTGEVSMIDPFMMKRDGVFYVLWKAEVALTNPDNLRVSPAGKAAYDVPITALGWAASASLLGPYNSGDAFKLPDGTFIKGEGQQIIELPAGFGRRYRLIWDQLGGPSFGYADTDDLINFPGGAQQLGDFTESGNNYNRHGTFVLGLIGND